MIVYLKWGELFFDKVEAGYTGKTRAAGYSGCVLLKIKVLTTKYCRFMEKKKKTGNPAEIPSPGKKPEITPIFDPAEPVIPEVDPDFIPDDDPEETPPFEIPPPGEGP